jgi:hypothetical protein
MTYNYLHDGSALPIGEAPIRQFASNEFELYFSDSWRASRSLTLTYGVRYTNFGVPYERNGLQVAPVFPLQDFFAERLGGMQAGIPSNALPHALMSYDFNGPANGKDGVGCRIRTTSARGCRLHTARTTTVSGEVARKNGVIRGGSAMFDRFSDLVTQFDTALRSV